MVSLMGYQTISESLIYLLTHRKGKLSTRNAAKYIMMKPATFDGSVGWMDYKAHYDACAELNG